ncbi:lycopene cyclase domain-containing protein [Diaminobutyricibacter tongyongensis]|uniref:Lycopene cyclase domain-containing protein n=1 Tax=Leifsonia tongyongensis TaxID=1268043 RepID=A0A6L9XXD8_9MICO|nr:lycopene cyclase domain-containing protein [Diaminobutyricibacter tongyongensis]
MSILYLLSLLGALGCMVLLDRRFRLFFWRDAWRATVVGVIGLVFFVVWDLLGIALGIFARGEAPISTGVLIAPELPIEELFFLAFLCYLTMILIAGARLVLDRGRRRP